MPHPSCISKFLAFDQFGIPPSLTVRGNSKFNSCLGFLFTVLLSLFLLGFSIYFFTRLIGRKDIITNETIQKGSIKDVPLYLNETLNMSFTLYDGSGHVYNDGTYFVPMAWVGDGFNYYPLNVEICPGSDRAYCIFPSDAWPEPLFVNSTNFVMVSIYPNPYSGVSLDVIEETALTVQAWFAYNDWAVDLTNFSTPISYTSKWQPVPFPVMNATKIYGFGLLQVEIDTDRGWLLESVHTQNVSVFDSNDNDMKARISQTDSFFDMWIVSRTNNHVYTRRYDKLQDIFADITGLAALTLWVTAFVIFPFVNFRMRQSFVNSYFVIREKEKCGHNNFQNPRRPLREKSTMVNSQNENGRQDPKDIAIEIPPQLTSNIPPPKEKGIELCRLETEKDIQAAVDPLQNDYSDFGPPKRGSVIKVKVSLWERFISLFKPRRHYMTLKKAEDKLTESLDLIVLAQKVAEIDKLKACLFSHDQRVLFEEFAKPRVMLSKEAGLKHDDAVQIYDWHDKVEVNEQKLMESFLNIKGLPEKSRADIRLLSLYEGEYLHR